MRTRYVSLIGGALVLGGSCCRLRLPWCKVSATYRPNWCVGIPHFSSFWGNTGEHYVDTHVGIVQYERPEH